MRACRSSCPIRTAASTGCCRASSSTLERDGKEVRSPSERVLRPGGELHVATGKAGQSLMRVLFTTIRLVDGAEPTRTSRRRATLLFTEAGPSRQPSAGASRPRTARSRSTARLGLDHSLRHELRVRYGECDPQGIVFNANYLLYFDVAFTSSGARRWSLARDGRARRRRGRRGGERPLSPAGRYDE